MSKTQLFDALETAENGRDILLILEAIEALYWYLLLHLNNTQRGAKNAPFVLLYIKITLFLY